MQPSPKDPTPHGSPGLAPPGQGKLPVGIVGASGYSGVEATRILAQHPLVDLRFLSSKKWSGELAGSRIGLSGAAGKLSYSHPDGAFELARQCAAVLLATPVEVSLDLVPRLLEEGVQVIDLSGAFRLHDTEAFERFYGLSHPHPELLGRAVYGLPELSPLLFGARLIANPGCYATAAALALAPLLQAGLLEGEPLVIDAASGTTGAGRQGTEELSFTEVDEEFRAYKVLRHQHTPEIVQTLRGARLTFTAHLLPLKRGILATCYGRLAKGRGPEELQQALLHKYAGSPFVQVLGSPDEVGLRGVVGTNRCQIAVSVLAGGYDPGRVVVVAALDNLVKGAAGQAVQNLNLSRGFDEGLGLDTLRGFHP